MLIHKICLIMTGVGISILSIWAAFTVAPINLLAFPILAGFVITSHIRNAIEKSEVFEPKHVLGIIFTVWIPLGIFELFILFTLAFDFMSRAVPPIIALSIFFGFSQWLKTVWIDEIYTL